MNLIGPDFIFRLIAIVIGLVIHEFAHAWVASLLGDKTARRLGRVTLNPIAHLEPIGLIMILFGPFGWAKPVPVNAGAFKRPRLGMILVALAGPVSNLILCFLALVSLGTFATKTDFGLQLVFMVFVVNLALFLFNLIPVPPLDGSRILYSLLPARYEGFYRKLELYGPFVLLLIVLIPQFRTWLFQGLLSAVANLFLGWIGM